MWRHCNLLRHSKTDGKAFLFQICGGNSELSLLHKKVRRKNGCKNSERAKAAVSVLNHKNSCCHDSLGGRHEIRQFTAKPPSRRGNRYLGISLTNSVTAFATALGIIYQKRNRRRLLLLLLLMMVMMNKLDKSSLAWRSN